MTETERRAALVAEALSWERTPFAHGQCLKGVAADCSTFVAACYRHIGLFEAKIPTLQCDWFLHGGREWYVEEIERHATEFTLQDKTPQPGDIIAVQDTALCRLKKIPYSHGSIVVSWGPNPQIINCFPPCVMKANLRSHPAFVGKTLRYFDPFKAVRP